MPGVEVDEHDWQNTYGADGGDKGRSRTRKMLIIFTSLLGLAGIGMGIYLAVAGSNAEEEIADDNVPSPASPGRPTTPGPTPTYASTIRDIIQDNARNGGSEFEDHNSYQSRALLWVLTQDIPNPKFPEMTEEEQALQLYALACLFYSTYASESAWTNHHYGNDIALPGWFDSKGWVTDASTVCEWYGLTCDSKGRVAKIELDTNGLTGYLPAEIAYLKDSLLYIDLFNNIVHNQGDEGNSFLGELTNLKYLYLGQTSFQHDGIPTEIGLLTNLVEMDLSYTLYFGKLDGSVFANLSNLNYLVMDGLSFNSTLPQELVDLPNLEYLYAGNSFLEGDLNFVSQMPKIYELWIDDNPEIKGTIPTTLADATSLASWSTTGCALTGSIPAELAAMTDMVQMWLYDNQLTGEIPAELGDLKKLKILQLQKNEIGGAMPQEICDRRRPFGRLETLMSDCDGEVECADECCTCCGEKCIDMRRKRNKILRRAL